MSILGKTSPGCTTTLIVYLKCELWTTFNVCRFDWTSEAWPKSLTGARCGWHSIWGQWCELIFQAFMDKWYTVYSETWKSLMPNCNNCQNSSVCWERDGWLGLFTQCLLFRIILNHYVLTMLALQRQMRNYRTWRSLEAADFKAFLVKFSTHVWHVKWVGTAGIPKKLHNDSNLHRQTDQS